MMYINSKHYSIVNIDNNVLVMNIVYLNESGYYTTEA